MSLAGVVTHGKVLPSPKFDWPETRRFPSMQGRPVSLQLHCYSGERRASTKPAALALSRLKSVIPPHSDYSPDDCGLLCAVSSLACAPGLLTVLAE